MKSSLDMRITLPAVLKFSFPSIISMVLMTAFGAIDGIFISRFIDMESFAAMNIAFPILTTTLAVGFMIAAGGSALVAKKRGEEKDVEARENFSLLIAFTLVFSILASSIAFFFLEPLLIFLGANEMILPLAKEYITPIVVAIPIIILGFLFQKFLIADGRPTLAMIVSSSGGLIGVGLNFLLINYLDMGLFGASLGTAIAYSIPSVVGGIYFTFFRKEGLYFVRPKFVVQVITKSFTNGVSEFISMIAVSITATYMNNIVMNIEGPMGVAAVGIMMTVQGLITSTFLGYAFGVGPLISFNYGQENTDNLKKLYSLSLKIVSALAGLSILIAIVFASHLTRIYVAQGTPVYDMAVFGLRLMSASFILVAINSFASNMFVALNNGWVSGVLSFFRTLVLLQISLFVLPNMVNGMTGVWAALPFAELLAMGMTVYYFKKMKTKYQYA